MTINADKYTPVDSTSIPTGIPGFIHIQINFVNSFLNIFDFISFNSRDHAGDISDVQGTAWDLRTKTNIGEVIHSVPGGVGYDHNYCFGKTGWQKYMARYL